MPVVVIDVFEAECTSPPGRGERQVVVVRRDTGGQVVHDVVAICPSKVDSQTIRDALREHYRI
jgi:hypothetical protein